MRSTVRRQKVRPTVFNCAASTWTAIDRVPATRSSFSHLVFVFHRYTEPPSFPYFSRLHEGDKNSTKHPRTISPSKRLMNESIQASCYIVALFLPVLYFSTHGFQPFRRVIGISRPCSPRFFPPRSEENWNDGISRYEILTSQRFNTTITTDGSEYRETGSFQKLLISYRRLNRGPSRFRREDCSIGRL